MRVKLRPGTHFAPVPQGIYWSRAGRSFLLTAPAALFVALDSQLDRLTRGTDVDELTAALGESARPVLQRVLDTLLDRDVLLDLDRVTVPAPSEAEATRYAEVLSYLEARSADPYRVFAELRAAAVTVLGGGPAATVAARGVAAYGIGGPVGGAELTVLIDDPLDGSEAAAGPPPGTTVVPVHAGRDVALVGPPSADPAELAGFRALARRAGEWARADPDSAAPRPLSAVLAGSLAAHAVLSTLTGADPAAAVTVVFGRDVQTQRLPGTDLRDSADRWADGGDDADPGEPGTAEAVVESWSPLFARWTGLVRRGRDLDLEQLPMSLATAELVGAEPAGIAGWGEDRAQAGLSLGLAAARLLAARRASPAGSCAAAGRAPAHWLADGGLRLLGADLLAAGPPDDGPGWADVPAGSRTLWSLLEDYFDRPVRLVLHPASDLGWTLAEAAGGDIRSAEWGEDPQTAIRLALSGAVAQAQATPDVRTKLRSGGIGTHRLQQLGGATLSGLTRRLDAHAAARGLRLGGRRLVRDRVLGDLPLTLGLVRWR